LIVVGIFVMTKNLAWVGQSIVAAAFAVGVVGVEGAIALPIREIVTNISQQTKIPILIPNTPKGSDGDL
jgi:hypothetical protein